MRTGPQQTPTVALAAQTPRILWVELTSKCPVDCIFCSRKMRRGAGEHLPFEIYSSLLNALVDPRKFILNYSGESTVYPELIPAIQKARGTGASVEMVSVLATAPESLLGPLSQSGLNRLTVSLHATDPRKFTEVYRYSSFDALRSRLERFLELCHATPHPPVVDLAFVAMDANLAELPSVAALARALKLRDITIFPVLRRDSIPVEFGAELTAAGQSRPEFESRLQEAVDRTAESHPEIRLTVGNPPFVAGGRQLGEVPVPYPWELPHDAFVHSCEQNPWETAHVLSNGDIVACEVLDRNPLGNLREQSIGEIWNGERYRQFREQYRRGQVAECRTCPWKQAYRPHPYASEIVAARGPSAQLLYGWHHPDGEGHIWSSQQAAAVLAPRPGSRTLHVSGLLPPGPQGHPNHLVVRCSGTEIGRVTNSCDRMMPFGSDFPAGDATDAPWLLEFRTTHVYRPSEREGTADQRDLGFALLFAVSKEFLNPQRAAEQRTALQPIRSLVQSIDRWGRGLGRHWRRTQGTLSHGAWRPGLSVLIPEWDNATELAACLASVRDAAVRWSEPLEVVVVVNGSPKSCYSSLRQEHPEVRWLFYRRPLGFGGAIRAGLGRVHHDWVYLLNSDVVLDPSAFRNLAMLRADTTFSIGSQILLQDTTRFRDETNWGGLVIESGLATIHDWIPRSDAPVPAFYVGGGASLFRTSLLRELIDAPAYHPFYWEDVEWGWRARKLGYESWFCPGSIAYHTRRSTIGRHYPAETIERIIRRNALLFQLRNFTTVGSLERVMEEAARDAGPTAAHLLAPATRLKIARGRIWNYRSPLADEEVFHRWSASLPHS